MTRSLHLDLESRSLCDLKRAGVHKYAKDPTTDLWCARYAVDEGPVKYWVPGDPVPEAIKRAVKDGWRVVAHNAAFERVMWKFLISPRYGWPEPDLRQWYCTMAMAQAMSLPADLAGAGAAVGLNTQKDMAGHTLMTKMARPRSKTGDANTADPKLRRVGPRNWLKETYEDSKGRGLEIVWWGEQENRARLGEYCGVDVETERELETRVMQLRPAEQEVYWTDQIINDRGVRIDTALCKKAQEVVDEATTRLNNEMAALTGWRVTACTQAANLVLWLNAQGVECDSVAKDKVVTMLAREDLSPNVRRALELRQEAAKSSNAKITAMLIRAGEDDRARGLFSYHAASTGRWGGRSIQTQNMPRPTLKQPEIEHAIKVMKL